MKNIESSWKKNCCIVKQQEEIFKIDLNIVSRVKDWWKNSLINVE